MADIKQAAEWMQSGKQVRRRDEPDRQWRTNEYGHLVVHHRDALWRKESWHNDDLLADDWEIAP